MTGRNWLINAAAFIPSIAAFVLLAYSGGWMVYRGTDPITILVGATLALSSGLLALVAFLYALSGKELE